MGKKQKISFNYGSENKRWKSDLEEDNPELGPYSGGPRFRNDSIERERRAVKTLHNRMKLKYARCSRKMGTSTFFDPETGLPISKTRVHEVPQFRLRISEFEMPADDVIETTPTERYSIGLERRKHVFFDAHTGLEVEKSQVCLDEEHFEDKFSQVQETEDFEEVLPRENTAESAVQQRKKKKRKKMRRCQLVDNQCTINKLPFEVLEMILSNLPSADRKNCRLVNSAWYSALSKCEEYLSPIRVCTPGSTFKMHKKSWFMNELEECGLGRLHISFLNSDLAHLSTNFWENITSRIISLKLENCRLGSSIVQSLITYCKNLQCLKIALCGLGKMEEVFCAAPVLEELDILRPKLKTLKFRVPLNLEIRQEDGERVFTAFFRLFPNIETYSFRACTGAVTPAFKCTFTKAVRNDMAETLLLTNLFSFVLSTACNQWTEAMDMLSRVRLSRVSLRVTARSISNSERMVLKNFFTSQTALKTVKILPYDTCYALLKPVLFDILDHCSELREFIYCPSSTDDCTQNLMSSEWTEYASKLSKLKKLTISRFVIEKASLYSVLGPYSAVELRNAFGKTLMYLIQSFTYLEHLTLHDNVSDYILQTIFKHLRNLKTLDVCLGPNVTRYGLIGHYKFSNEESMNGVPISRLQYLEKLTLRQTYRFSMDYEIFTCFDFPKLTYLKCFLPQGHPQKQRWAMAHLGEQCNSLKTVEFSTAIDGTHLVDLLSYFCVPTKQLETLTVDVTEAYLSVDNAQKIFKFCPSLKTLYCKQFIYYPSEISGSVSLKYPGTQVNSHIFFTE